MLRQRLPNITRLILWQTTSARYLLTTWLRLRRLLRMSMQNLMLIQSCMVMFATRRLSGQLLRVRRQLIRQSTSWLSQMEVLLSLRISLRKSMQISRSSLTSWRRRLFLLLHSMLRLQLSSRSLRMATSRLLTIRAM